MPVAVSPMFPLGSVLFPYAVLPLQVFEPRYRVMMKHVLGGDQEFGVVLIERGSEVGGGDVRFDVGTIARVAQAAELPDGRYALTAVGMRRVRVAAWLDDDPYPRARIEPFDDPPAMPDDVDRRDAMVAALGRVAALARRIDPRIGPLPDLDPDPQRASYEAAAIAPIGPLDSQRLLATAETGIRLELLATLLDDHATYLRARLDSDDGS